MSRIRIPPGGLGARMQADRVLLPKAIRQGTVIAAHRGRSTVVKETPVDTGRMKNAWKVHEHLKAITVDNDAPYAGIVERGARPHPVSEEGIEAIAAWVRRNMKIILPAEAMPKGKKAREDQAREIAEKIAWKLRTKGQRGKFIVRSNLPLLVKFLTEEVVKHVRHVIEREGR